MSNKLSLLVNFVGVDKMSGSLRNIMALGKKGSRSLGDLRGEGRKLESQLRDVRREIAGASGNVSDLVNRERALESAIEDTNRQLDRRKKLSAIEGDRRAMVARGEDMKARGRDHIVQGAALATPIILATKAAAEFSSGMVDIQQKAALSNAQTDRLARNIVIMAKDAKQLPEDIRSGLDLLMAKGMGLDAATQAIGPAGRLATAYKVDIPDAADAAFASVNNLKVAGAETARIFDAMAAAGNEGGFEVRDMARHFPSLTAQMQALGEKGVPAVADLSAALQVAMFTAGNADEAGNNVKNLLAKINAPATIRAFEKNFGVNLPAAMKKLTDEGHSSLEAIAMITDKATGGDDKKLGFAFEDMQARMGIMALIQNLDEYRRIRAAALNSGGTVDQAFAQRTARDATVQWKAFLGSASALAITLGNTLLPVATQVLTMLSNLGNSVAAWAQRNPEAAATLAKLVAGLAVFKIGLGAVLLVTGGLMGPLATVVSLWHKFRVVGSLAAMLPRLATGLRLAGIAFRFMLGPVGLVISALVMLGIAVWQNWDKIKAAFDAGKAWLANFGSNMLAVGRDIVLGLARGIAGAHGAVWNALKGVVQSGVGKVKNLLGIKSPSRVFMAIGGHTAEGMAVGIDRGRRNVLNAAGRLATGAAAAGAMAMAPSVAAAGNGQARPGDPRSGGLQVTFNITQQPGEDAEFLADRVIRRLEQQAGIAARSNYQDS
ncbi:phage tail tape measure protein [Qipengyuania citrea]|uniref:phage tail tape measure protein n=1 Tax=Qipengyuania citrea TaxID=225971 RepID=UPI00209EFFB8|nr:phage tail tape measure protein [Qipengyuania citrea]MCP2016853.1 TP901 family phage tail tape measure protein [Qipengyuania citrea]